MLAIGIAFLEISTPHFLQRYALFLGAGLLLVCVYWLVFILGETIATICVVSSGMQGPLFCSQVSSTASWVGDLATFVAGIAFIVVSIYLRKREIVVNAPATNSYEQRI